MSAHQWAQENCVVRNKKMRHLYLACSVVALALSAAPLSRSQQGGPAPSAAANAQKPERHNVLIFITDGLRHDAVTPENAPTMYNLRQQGVDFANSHSLYPTFTTPNASAFATGHLLGDTGDFGNTLYPGHPVRNAANTTATLLPFIEDDSILAELNHHYDGNYLQEETLMDLARRNGYSVAAVGKVGPTAIQNIADLKSQDGVLQPTQAAVIDDATGPKGIPIPAQVRREMTSTGLSAVAPDRSNWQTDPKQSNGRSGTLAANWSQQQYFVNTVTQAILPSFKKAGQPWLLVYWSRDPDGSQHNQGDSLGQLAPGINGPTSRAAIRNVDNNLWQIIDYLKANGLYDTTDIVVVADHGFSTISRREIARDGTPTSSYAATKAYAGVKEGFLPPGFLGIDLAHALKKSIYDPDGPIITTEHGSASYYPPLNTCDDSRLAEHALWGSAIIGGTGKVPAEGAATDAEILVAAGGGSDLIYLPQEGPGKAESNRKLAAAIVEFLLQQDYVDGVFVRDDLGDLPGTLPMSAVGLMGATRLPKPAMYVNFKSFSLGPGLLSRVEIADTVLQEGQGMHGSFSRADTFNNMLAAGPDFKSNFVSRAPASNADIAVTVAEIMGWIFKQDHGSHRGRVLTEALRGKPDAPQSSPQVKSSSRPGPGGARTVLMYQTHAGHTYFDQACLIKASEGAGAACK